MTEDLFLDLLLKESVARLRQRRAENEEVMRTAKRDAHYIDKALKIKGAADSQGGRATRPTRQRKSQSKAGSSREPIREIVASDASRAWMPAEVRDLLASRGIDVATGTVRATMKRLLDEGEFARPYEGGHGFKLASTNGSAGEPPTEATSSGAGGMGETAP